MSEPIPSASALIPFAFESHAVRIIIREGEPWFVATVMYVQHWATPTAAKPWPTIWMTTKRM
jgi:hypothetical protein